MDNKENKFDNDFMFYGIDGDIKNIIKTLKFRRIEKKLSQRDLAKIIKMKQSAIARFEKGESNPKLETIILIARALDLVITFKRINTGWSDLLDNNIDNIEENS
ncbi:MAG: helix-turn-helix domain-containing protein [Bacillales bacterium]